MSDSVNRKPRMAPGSNGRNRRRVGRKFIGGYRNGQYKVYNDFGQRRVASGPRRAQRGSRPLRRSGESTQNRRLGQRSGRRRGVRGTRRGRNFQGNQGSSMFRGRRFRRRANANNNNRTTYTTKISTTSLFVSNLHKSVNNEELKSIFQTQGRLKRCGIHYSQAGDSKGTADIEYENPEDAERAIKTFNNSEVEGVTMKVEYGKRRIKKRVFRKRLGHRRNRASEDVEMK